MRSTMQGKEHTKLFLAWDALHTCKFCAACGGDWRNVGACDYFHDKQISPTGHRVCKHWELNLGRIDSVPTECAADLAREIGLEGRARELSGSVEELRHQLSNFIDLLKRVPDPLKAGMPETAWMSGIYDSLGWHRFILLIKFFEDFSIKLEAQETDWSLRLRQMNSQEQVRPKEEK